jgi:hypothetical protein
MSHHLNRRGLRGGKLRALALAAVLLPAASGAIAATPSQAATLPSLSLTMNASSITVGGTAQSGAVNVVMNATGLKEPSAILFQLKPGVSVAEFEAFMKTKAFQDPNNADQLGSITFDAEPANGKPTEAQTVLQPGQYIALVVVGEGKPKALTSFTVAAAAAPAALPAAQATVKSIEFGFRGPSKLHDGELVRFENEGFLVHMDIAFPVKSRKAAKTALRALRSGKERKLRKLLAGAPISFQGPLSHGGFQQETINAKPGFYVQACFMDTQDGRSHTRLGMERIIKIVK